MIENSSLYLKKNVGSMGQVIRIVLGALLIIAPVLLNWSLWSIAILAAIGGAQVLEGLIAY